MIWFWIFERRGSRKAEIAILLDYSHANTMRMRLYLTIEPNRSKKTTCPCDTLSVGFIGNMTNSRMHGIFGALLKDSLAAQGKAAMPPMKSASIPVMDDDDAVIEDATTPAVQLKKGQIAVDIFEEGGYLIIKAPIAGVKLADLDIDVADTMVTIRGRREQTDVIQDNQYLLKECYWGDFERKVTLPCSVNPTKVRATFSKDGILKIFVPKEESRKVKIVKINEGG